jgi:hypothetical protein
MAKKLKKVSIREFVSENEIKFQLYLMKYANQLKNIEEMTSEEITEKWNYDTQKKINRFLGDAEKPQWQTDIAQDVIKKNIAFLKSLPAPTDKDLIIETFENIKKEYIEYLEERIKENSTATLKQDQELLNNTLNLVLTSKPSKERFGIILLLMIKNLRTMPSFSGYSENWASDFFSNAVEKTLLYLDNFDERLLSKRTGERSKAFAYVTQICFNAFVNIINIRKKENEFLKDTISYETHNFDGVQDLLTKIRDKELQQEQNFDGIHKIIIKKKDSIERINERINEAFFYINYINEVINTNKALKDEVDYIKKTTPEEEKTEDFYNYLNGLEIQYCSIVETIRKDTLFVKILEDTDISDIKYENEKGLNIVISSKDERDIFSDKTNKKKQSKSFNGYDTETGLTKKQQDELVKMEADTQDELDFNDEW